MKAIKSDHIVTNVESVVKQLISTGRFQLFGKLPDSNKILYFLREI